MRSVICVKWCAHWHQRTKATRRGPACGCVTRTRSHARTHSRHSRNADDGNGRLDVCVRFRCTGRRVQCWTERTMCSQRVRNPRRSIRQCAWRIVGLGFVLCAKNAVRACCCINDDADDGRRSVVRSSFREDDASSSLPNWFWGII